MKAFEELDDWAKGERLEGMAKSIRVNGAAHHDSIQKVLCAKCEHGLVFRQKSGNQPVRVLCSFVGKGVSIPTDIDECSQFEAREKHKITLEDMAKQALTIDLRAMPPSKNTYL